jgi:anti-sigma factor RsiW
VSPDLETLRAYVDGELPQQHRAALEAALAVNPELAAQVDMLYASRLPYQRAFAQAPVPPVPETLQARVAELAAVALASQHVPQDIAVAGAGGHRRRRLAFAGLLLLGVGAGVGYAVGLRRTPGDGPAVEPWLLKVASYHSMYTRETVLDDGTGLAQAAVLKQRLSQQLGLHMKVPDLSAQGLRFARAQQLQFEGRLVVQLVYLPQTGAPVALCLMRAAAQPERLLVLQGLQVLAWHAEGWAYVLIGEPGAQLQTIKRRTSAAVV